MNDSKNLKLLVVEDDLEDEELLCQALIEIEENRQWCNWRTASIVHVEQLSDALDCLRRDWFDAILLNLSLPDSPVLLDSYLEVNALARGTPIVVLADQEDENLANRLLREGAQDVFLKPELECAPLARSLRYAIERQRRTKALGDSLLLDDLTGTLTRPAFLTIAQHFVQISELHHTHSILAIIEFLDADRDSLGLLLMRAGEALQEAVPAPVIIGRLDRSRFGLLTSGFTGIEMEQQLHQALAQIEHGTAARMGFSTFELNGEENLDDLIGHRPADHSLVPARPETVMLAD